MNPLDESFASNSNHHSSGHSKYKSMYEGCTAIVAMAATTELLEAYGQFWSLALGFAAPLAIKAALQLDLFDIISKSQVPQGPTLDEIVSKLRAAEAPRPQNLSRLLKFLVVKKVLRLSTVTTSSGSSEARYGLTKVSELLVSDNDYCVAPMLRMLTDEAIQLGWHHISDVVRSTGNGFFRAHGKEPWEYAAEHPEFNKTFNDAMRSTNKITFAALARSYDGFKSVRKLVDVGGGTGSFIAEIVKAYPHIQGFNFDLPHVVAQSPAYPGVESISGNALESIPSADAILMKTLLHSQNDVDAARILGNCHRALTRKGKLIICDMVLEDTEECVVFDMLMLAAADGIERSQQQWRDLLTSTGFGAIRIFNTCTPHSVIEAIKQ